MIDDLCVQLQGEGGTTMKKLLGLIADVNPNEIAAHIADGTLVEWCERWRQVATVEVENLRLSEKDLYNRVVMPYLESIEELEERDR